MYFTGPPGMEMPRKSLRLAGAQIPVGTNIQANKREILKALDWVSYLRDLITLLALMMQKFQRLSEWT
mgnify:CR=1 FL=1